MVCSRESCHPEIFNLVVQSCWVLTMRNQFRGLEMGTLCQVKYKKMKHVWLATCEVEKMDEFLACKNMIRNPLLLVFFAYFCYWPSLGESELRLKFTVAFYDLATYSGIRDLRTAKLGRWAVMGIIPEYRWRCFRYTWFQDWRFVRKSVRLC